MTEIDTIYRRLDRMAVAQARVVDRRTIPGTVTVEIDGNQWRREESGADLGYLDLYVRNEPTGTFHDNVFVAMTRFVVDATVEVNGLFDDVFASARALPDWMEQRADRAPVSERTEGAALQSGCYRDRDHGWLYTVTRYVAYQRGNVAYLLQMSATTASQRSPDWAALTRIVQSVRFDD